LIGFRDDFSAAGSTAALDNGSGSLAVNARDPATGNEWVTTIANPNPPPPTLTTLASYTWPWQDTWLIRQPGNLQAIGASTDAAPGLEAPPTGYDWAQAGGTLALIAPQATAVAKARAVLGVYYLDHGWSVPGLPQLQIVRQTDIGNPLAMIGGAVVSSSLREAMTRSWETTSSTRLWTGAVNDQDASAPLATPFYLIIDADNNTGKIIFTMAQDEAGQQVGATWSDDQGLPGDGSPLLAAVQFDVGMTGPAASSQNANASLFSVLSWNYGQGSIVAGAQRTGLIRH
jgi:hypothetical protein